jgi:hypothetical protein
MSDTMVTTAEHTIPVQGFHFNGGRQIPEQHPDVGTGAVFLSTFNVPNAIHIVVPSTQGEVYIRLQYENSEPSEKSPREAGSAPLRARYSIFAVPATTYRFGPSEFCTETTDGLPLRRLALPADDHSTNSTEDQPAETLNHVTRYNSITRTWRNWQTRRT